MAQMYAYAIWNESLIRSICPVCIRRRICGDDYKVTVTTPKVNYFLLSYASHALYH